MGKSPIYLGDAEAKEHRLPIEGSFVFIDGEPFYQIANYDTMRPFFMSIVSDSDHWMFISSLGSLSAGRQNPEHALFPYYTVDKIHDSHDLTGSKTIVLVERDRRIYLWEPFSRRYEGIYACMRNIYKSVYGDKIRFEEDNRDLGLRFSYTWCTGEQAGFVKKSQIENIGAENVTVTLLDGIQNLLHFGVEQQMQNERSNLLDAYKKSELDVETGLGLFALSSLVVDKPIPSEALKATTVWCTGAKPEHYLVSMRQLDAFRSGAQLHTEVDVRAERGGYFIQTSSNLSAGQQNEWYIVAEIEQGPEEVVGLLEQLKSDIDLTVYIKNDVQAGTTRLRQIVASSDGLQSTGDAMTTARHYANVLFNVMRGGVFDNNNMVDRDDVHAFIAQYNTPVAERQKKYIEQLPGRIPVQQLIEGAYRNGDAQLERLCYEYVPLIFSRRHGDPSRPWNAFSIDLRNEDGSLKRSYQGNWRDIFQNWEALCLSFPAFTESIISKFVNASTVDGYNPYRVTREGIDWEVMDPADPWSYIGYWGDHQIIYLLKLLEISRDHHPEHLQLLLSRDLFAYANVPYRIKPYEELLHNPHDTIVFDKALEQSISERVDSLGADGKLVLDKEGEVLLVNLTEKLLVSFLAKMSNFIPEGGIWMNTQRPEWNDANNALVGYGVSMVTLCYLRRFCQFMQDMFASLEDQSIAISEEVEFLFVSVIEALAHYKPMLAGSFSDTHRKEVMDALGGAGSAYRSLVYERGFTGNRKSVYPGEICNLMALSLEHIDHTIWANQRSDHLFHSYNLIRVDSNKGTVAISHLYEMLEGQVAALSTGLLSGQQTVNLLTSLKNSALYREDQNSYVLYPDRSLPRFVDKNNLAPNTIETSELLKKLVDASDTRLIVKDINGAFHFSGDVKDREVLDLVLSELKLNGYEEEVSSEREHIHQVYAGQFRHTEYTGRSGTFFGYEGLGCIYWHMVSKLVLAIKETYYRLLNEGQSAEILGRVIEAYYDVRAGIGLNKSPEVYGAFPFDPYSHTPGNAGARQPGMTGQVKEDIISRWGELGVRVKEGKILFKPVLLRANEFLELKAPFEYFDIHGEFKMIDLAEKTLAFTYCQIPIVYHLAESQGITVNFADGNTEKIDGLQLNRSISALIFNRSGTIESLDVYLTPLL